MNKFTPLVIGLPDTKREKQIIEVYSEMCDIATVLVINLQYYFDSPHFEIREMFDFLKAKDPKEWLYSKFIEYHGLTFPGMNLEKVIQFELVDIPKDYLQESIALRTQILCSISKSNELGFYFPLMKLFHESKDEDCRDFATSYQYEGLYPTPEFDAALFNHVRKFTVSESDNEVLQAIEKTIDSLNDLVRLGIIRNTKARWQNDIERFVNAIVFNNYQERPLSVNPRLAELSDFRRFFSKPDFIPRMGNTSDILKFDGIAISQTDSQEELLQSKDHKFQNVEEITENMLLDGDMGADHTEAKAEEVLQT